MKTGSQHYAEFRAYCRTLTDLQVENVLNDETQRRRDNPGDVCAAACYAAAHDEWKRRTEE